MTAGEFRWRQSKLVTPCARMATATQDGLPIVIYKCSFGSLPDGHHKGTEELTICGRFEPGKTRVLTIRSFASLQISFQTYIINDEEITSHLHSDIMWLYKLPR